MDCADPWAQQFPGETHTGYGYSGDGDGGISCGGSYGDGAALEYPFQSGDGGFSPLNYQHTTYGDAFHSPGNTASSFGSPVEYCHTPSPYHQQTLTPGGYSTSQYQRHASYLQYQQPLYEAQGNDYFQNFQAEHEYPFYDTISRPGNHVAPSSNDPVADESSPRHTSLRSNKHRRVSKVSDSGALLSPVSIESPVSSTNTLVTATNTGTLPRSRQQQYERTRQKNREAASKCREKTKRNVEDLRRHERELSSQKQVLTALAAELKEEVLALKHEILMHGNCECEHIQKYLSTAAKQIA